jgi:hypothetical protein
VNPNNKLFLDTTVQIDRFSGDPEKKVRIDRVISQSNRVLTSTYVKMEFRRRFIQDIVYLYNVITDADNLKDVFLRINKLPPELRRKKEGCLASFCRFFSGTEEEEIKGPFGKGLLEKAEIYFRLEIEDSWEEFDKEIDEIINETDCYHAKTGPVLTDGKYYNKMNQCKKTDLKCRIIDFFIKNKVLIDKIYEKLSQMENLDDEQQKAKKAIENFLKDNHNIADKKNCWNCGDIIIALEAPIDAVLSTTNVKHFEPICSVIGKEYSRPS